MTRRQMEQAEYEAATERIPVDEIQAARARLRQAPQDVSREGRGQMPPEQAERMSSERTLSEPVRRAPEGKGPIELMPIKRKTMLPESEKQPGGRVPSGAEPEGRKPFGRMASEGEL